MDIELARALYTALAPVLPYLGQKTIDTATTEALKGVGKATGAKMRAVWKRLRRAGDGAALDEAARRAAEGGGVDREAVKAFVEALARILEADAELANEARSLVHLTVGRDVRRGGDVGGRAIQSLGDNAHIEQHVHIHAAPPAPGARVEARPAAQRREAWRAEVSSRWQRPDFNWIKTRQHDASKLTLERLFFPVRVVETPRPFAGAEEEPDAGRRGSAALFQGPVGALDPMGQCFVLLGEPGAGKSTFLRLHAQRAAQQEGGRTPFLVELATLHEWLLRHEKRSQPTLTTLAEYLAGIVGDTTAGEVAAWMAGGGCVLLFDGLDEIADERDRRHMARFLSGLLAVLLPHAGVFVSCRRQAYATAQLTPGPDAAALRHFVLQPLSGDEVRDFVVNVRGALHEADTGKAADPAVLADEAKRFVVELQNPPPRLAPLLRNPMMLSLLILVDPLRVPRSRVGLYEDVLRVLLSGGHRGGEGDKRNPTLPNDMEGVDLLPVAASLAFRMHLGTRTSDPTTAVVCRMLAEALEENHIALGARRESTLDQVLDVLGAGTGLLVRRGVDRHAFWHRTFQEYLAARHIAASSWPKLFAVHVAPELHDPHWSQVLLFLTGLRDATDAARPFLEGLLRAGTPYEEHVALDLRLALRCMGEGLALEPAFVSQVVQKARGWTRRDPAVALPLLMEDAAAVSAGPFAPVLVADLWARAEDDDEALSSLALQAIGRLGGARDLQRLARFAGTATGGPRAAALDSLSVLATGDDVPFLHSLLDDGDADFRWAALHALERVGGASSAPAVGRLLEDPDPEVQRLAWALTARWAPAAHLAALVPWLWCEDMQVRESALAALGGRPGVWSPHAAAATTLQLLGRPLPRGNPIPEALRALAQRTGVKALFPLLRDAEVPVSGAAWSLLPQVARAADLPAVAQLLGSGEEKIRMAAANALRDIHERLRRLPDDAVLDPWLAQVQDPSDSVRAATVRSLAPFAGIRPVRTAMVDVLTGSDGRLRPMAAGALAAHVLDPSVLPVFLSILEDGMDPVRDKVLEALRLHVERPDVRTAFLRDSRSADRYVRLSAVKSLAPVASDPEVLEMLIRRLLSEEGSVGEAAARALAPIAKEHRVQSALLLALQRGEGFVQMAALQALLPLADDDAVRAAMLGRLYAEDPFVRGFAVEHLSGLADRADVRQALTHVMERPGSHVKATVEVLSRHIEEPEVRDAFLGLLNEGRLTPGGIQALSRAASIHEVWPRLRHILETAKGDAENGMVAVFAAHVEKAHVRAALTERFPQLTSDRDQAFLALAPFASDPNVRAVLLPHLERIVKAPFQRSARALVAAAREPSLCGHVLWALPSASSEVQQQMVTALALMTDDAAVRAALVDRMDNGVDAVAEAAAHALAAASANRQALGAVLARLGSRRAATRSAAVKALASWVPHRPDIYDALVARLHDGPKAAGLSVVEILAPYAHDAKVRAELVRRLTGRYLVVRRALMRALAPHADDADVRRALQRCAESDPRLGEAAVAALALQPPTREGSVETVEDDAPSDSDGVPEAEWAPRPLHLTTSLLGQQVDRDDLPRLRATLEDRRVRVSVMEAITRLVDRRDMELLGQLAAHPDASVRRLAAATLQRLATRADLGFLLTLLDGKGGAREAALRAMERLVDASDQALLARLAQHPEWEVRLAAATMFRRVGGARDVVLPLVWDADREVRAAAVEAVGAQLAAEDLLEIGRILSQPLLPGENAHARHGIVEEWGEGAGGRRHWGVASLLLLGAPADVAERVRTEAERDEDWRLRWIVAEVVARKGEHDVAALARLAEDADARVRRSAYLGIGVRRAAGGTDTVQAGLLHAVEHVRQAALTAFTELAAPEDLAEVAALVAASPSPEARLAAAHAIGAVLRRRPLVTLQRVARAREGPIASLRREDAPN